MNTMFPNNQNSLMSQFLKFKSDFQKSGKDPASVLNEMINSGKVSQEQLNKAKMLASLFGKQFK